MPPNAMKRRMLYRPAIESPTWKVVGADSFIEYVIDGTEARQSLSVAQVAAILKPCVIMPRHAPRARLVGFDFRRLYRRGRGAGGPAPDRHRRRAERRFDPRQG